MVALSQFFRPAVPAAAADDARVAIIDIGSNSIRLVVYDGPARVPAILFNEKVMAGLGRGVAADGAIASAAIQRALSALARFRAIARQMQVTSLRTVATAAVRDATNGAALVERINALGLDVELLSGEMEAEMAAMGVLAGIPAAEGIVGDLGGGSLELVRIADGRPCERLSLPLGVLRLDAIRCKGPRALDLHIGRALEAAGWGAMGADQPFYLVGGSWRALARLDMHRTHYPLPIMHQYEMPAEAASSLVRMLAQLDRRRLKTIQGLSSSRIPTLPGAAALLSVLVRRLRSRTLIVSAFGLREGLLYAGLPEAVRREDPLIAAARDEGGRQGRFAEHGDLLDRWIDPLFADETAEDARLRHAACLLGDVGWRAHPDFRAERGMEFALHGNWVGIEARGRAMMAQALYTSFGGSAPPPAILSRLAPIEDLERAVRWGLAMRLGQRLSGGAAGALEVSRLSLDDEALVLHLVDEHTALNGETVERRHKVLAAAIGRKAVRVAG